MALYVPVPVGVTLTTCLPGVGEYQLKTTLRLTAVDVLRLTTLWITPSIEIVIEPRLGPFGAMIDRLRPVNVIDSFALDVDDPTRVDLNAAEDASFCQLPVRTTDELRSS
jgi:hypothetical protein